MNKQDREDYQQDFEVWSLANSLTFENANRAKAGFVKKKRMYTEQKLNRQQKLNMEYAHLYIVLTESGLNEDQIFNVISNVNFLTAKQYQVVTAFLQSGDLTVVATKLNKNYNTTKALFLQATTALKSLTKEKHERNNTGRNDLM